MFTGINNKKIKVSLTNKWLFEGDVLENNEDHILLSQPYAKSVRIRKFAVCSLEVLD